MDRINVWDFKDIIQKDFERFKTFWLENQINTPEDFPVRMDEAEWWEQFMCFLQLEEDMK